MLAVGFAFSPIIVVISDEGSEALLMGALGHQERHDSAGGPYPYRKAKQKPYPNSNVPRWAKSNRRNGPKEVAKRSVISELRK